MIDLAPPAGVHRASKINILRLESPNTARYDGKRVFPSLPNVYHLTNTLHLPWIIESGELRPHTNHLPGVGAVSYHWATANRTGDKTAMAVMVAKDRPLPWEEDLYRLVRFSLPGDAFLTWTEIIRRDGFTADQVAERVESDHKHHGEFGHDKWRCRQDPLPLDQVLKVEARTYSGRWRPIDISPDRVVRTNDPDCMGFRVGRGVHYAVRELIRHVDGAAFYSHRPLYLDSDELADKRYAERLDQDDDSAGAVQVRGSAWPDDDQDEE